MNRHRDWSSGVIGYPDPAAEVLDPKFESIRLLAAAIERLWSGARWAEDRSTHAM